MKTIYGFNNNTTSATVLLYTVSQTYLGSARVISQTVEPVSLIEWSGWLVLEPLDQIWADIDSPTVDVWASGALLPGVAT